MKFFPYFLALAVLIIFSGCVYSRVYKLQKDQQYQPISLEEVVIFDESIGLPENYEKIAIISTSYESGWDNTKWNAVRKKCAKIGANGVFQKTEKLASAGEKLVGAFFFGRSTDEAEFVAIRFNEAEMKKDENFVHKVVEEMPIFPGCKSVPLPEWASCTHKAFLDFIKQHLEYPSQSPRKKINGTFVVSFIVEKNGSLSNIKVSGDLQKNMTKNVQQFFGKALVQTVELMNEKEISWTPGRQKDEVVRVIFNGVVTFKNGDIIR